MLVSEYRTYIAPKTTLGKTQELPKESSTTRFTLPRTGKADLPASLAARPNFPNYMQNRNYFANKERFGHNQEIPTPLKNFQQLSKLKQLPEAYSVSSVTFFDLTKPKKALAPSRFTVHESVDEKFSTLNLLAARSLAGATYHANDIYYKQAYAS